MRGRVESDGGSWWLEWGVAQKSKYERCGDGYSLLHDENKVAAIVVDAVGSGNEAHHVANRAIQVAQDAQSFDINTLFGNVHVALKSEARGAAMAIAVLDFSQGSITWAAVGEIDGVLHHPPHDRLSLIQRNGTLGFAHPKPLPSQEVLAAGASVVLATDGIKSGFRKEIPHQDSKKTADTILLAHGRPSDDCTCLCLRVGAG